MSHRGRQTRQETRAQYRRDAKKLQEWAVELDGWYWICKTIRAYLILVGILGVVFLICGSIAEIKTRKVMILSITGLGLATASGLVRGGIRIVEHYITLTAIEEVIDDEFAFMTKTSKAVENMRSWTSWLLIIKDAGEFMYFVYVAKELKLIAEECMYLILKCFPTFITKSIIGNATPTTLATFKQIEGNIGTSEVLGGEFEGAVLIIIGIIFLVINTVELLLTKRDLNNNQSSNAAKSLIAKADEINERISRT